MAAFTESPLHWVEDLDWKAYAVILRLHELEDLGVQALQLPDEIRPRALEGRARLKRSGDRPARRPLAPPQGAKLLDARAMGLHEVVHHFLHRPLLGRRPPARLDLRW